MRTMVGRLRGLAPMSLGMQISVSLALSVLSVALLFKYGRAATFAVNLAIVRDPGWNVEAITADRFHVASILVAVTASVVSGLTLRRRESCFRKSLCVLSFAWAAFVLGLCVIVCV
jgi:hypothetical protein